MPNAQSIVNLILGEVLPWGHIRRERHVIYMHPARLREVVRDLSRDEMASLGLEFSDSRRIAGLELIETSRIAESPGWLILPRPQKRNDDGSTVGTRHRDQFHPRERS